MKGYLVYDNRCSDQPTSNGFGSIARSVLYPLLHIAVTCDLQLVWPKDALVSDTARDYSGLPVHQFLSLPDTIPASANEKERQREVVVNTWSGSHHARGDPSIVAEEILDDYLRNDADDALTSNNDGSASDSSSPTVLVIHLQGTFQCMDPTPLVYQWLQDHSASWNDFEGTLRIAAHVRVPEGCTPVHWKEDNHVSKLIKALDTLNEIGVQIEDCELDIYTEEHFSRNDEISLKHKYGNACINRGSVETLLDDIKAMAAADVFVPSSSHLSALVGYLTHSVILIDDESRWQYFESHRELGCNLIDASLVSEHHNHHHHGHLRKNLQDKLVKKSPRTTTNTS